MFMEFGLTVYVNIKYFEPNINSIRYTVKALLFEAHRNTHNITHNLRKGCVWSFGMSKLQSFSCALSYFIKKLFCFWSFNCQFLRVFAKL